jgi:hypothetical protein
MRKQGTGNEPPRALSKGHGQKMTRYQDRVIAALLTHGRVKEAAAACGVSHDAVRRWLKEPSFKDAYDEARRAELDETIATIGVASKHAVACLVRNMRCGIPASEISAARTLLELVLKPSSAGAIQTAPLVKVEIEFVYPSDRPRYDNFAIPAIEGMINGTTTQD